MCQKTRLSHASFRSKLVDKWLHLGKQRSKFGQDVASVARNCPYCQLPEDFRHFLTCSSPRALKVRYDATAVLRKALDASPGATALFQAVQQWTTNPGDPVVLSPYPRNRPGTVEVRYVASSTSAGLICFAGLSVSNGGTLFLFWMPIPWRIVVLRLSGPWR